MPDVSLLPLAFGLPVLLWAAWTDFFRLRIPNAAVLTLVTVFVGSSPVLGAEELALRLLAATGILIICVGLFAASLIGGGDAKMGPALILLVPFGTYTQFAYLFSAALLATIGFVALVRASPILAASRARSLQTTGTIPMGLAFAGTSAAHLGLLMCPVGA